MPATASPHRPEAARHDPAATRGNRNDRFRDLNDLLLMEELVTAYAGLRAACELVFWTRGTHDSNVTPMRGRIEALTSLWRR
jgi:hypothetical protein